MNERMNEYRIKTKRRREWIQFNSIEGSIVNMAYSNTITRININLTRERERKKINETKWNEN